MNRGGSGLSAAFGPGLPCPLEAPPLFQLYHAAATAAEPTVGPAGTHRQVCLIFSPFSRSGFAVIVAQTCRQERSHVRCVSFTSRVQHRSRLEEDTQTRSITLERTGRTHARV